MSGERGQSSVELVALLPVVCAVALAVAVAVVALSARDVAAEAASAGALALVQERDPRAAAHDVLGKRRARVVVRGGRVSVVVRPRFPLGSLEAVLVARAAADAGPPAAASAPAAPVAGRGGDGRPG